MIRRLPRAVQAFLSVLFDRLFLNMPERLRPAAACDLDDESLVKWSRWALANVSAAYQNEAHRGDRDLQEVVVQSAVVALAQMTLKTKSSRATFDVAGVSYCGVGMGDWRVTIERTAPPAKAIEARSDETASPVRPAGRKRGAAGIRPYISTTSTTPE